MTNTLHRKGTNEELKGDFVLFALPKGPIPDLINKLIKFTNICLKHKPVNMGKVVNRSLRRIDPRKMEEEMKKSLGLTATFNDINKLAAIIAELKEADLGISINVSGLFKEVQNGCKKAGMSRHSVEHSLGIFGKKEKLPPLPILQMNTLCGHGLVSFNLIKKIVDEVKLGRMTPEDGAHHMAKPCECGAFNPSRAKELIESMLMMG
jgi:hypothetical protein